MSSTVHGVPHRSPFGIDAAVPSGVVSTVDARDVPRVTVAHPVPMSSAHAAIAAMRHVAVHLLAG
jgi:hypothetical protein